MGYVLPVLTKGATVGRYDAWDPKVDEVISMVQKRWLASKKIDSELKRDIDGDLWLKPPTEAHRRLWPTPNANHNPDLLPHTPNAGRLYDLMVSSGHFPNWKTGQFGEKHFHKCPGAQQLHTDHVNDVKTINRIFKEHGVSDPETVRAALSLWTLVLMTEEEHKSLVKNLPESHDFSQVPDGASVRYGGLVVLPPRRDWRTGQLAVIPPVAPTPAAHAEVQVLAGVANTNATVPAPLEPAEDGLSLEEVSHLLGEVLQRRGVDPVVAELVTLRQEVQELRKQLSFLAQTLAATPAHGPWARFLAWTGLFPSTKRVRKITPEMLKRIIGAEARQLQQGTR